MNIVRTGKHYPDPLSLPVKVHPINRAKSLPLKRLDYLLGMLTDQDTYVEKLTETYEELSKGSSDVDVGAFSSGLQYLGGHTALLKAYIRYYVKLLAVDTESLDSDVEVENRNYLKAFLFPDYFNLKVLTQILGRETGIGLWKRFITEYVIDNRVQGSVKDVDTLYQRHMQGNPNSEWVIVRSVIADGKYAYKNENCTWIEAMESLPDPELKYYVCCYGDYEKARSTDQNLMLTMEHTLAEGDPYCSRVLHDVRVDWKFHHPPKEFWDKFSTES